MDKTSSADAGKTNEKKALSIVALVFGILGIISCWAPFFGLICCLVGVILGIVALVKKNQKGMAIAGLVCGAIGLIPAVIISLATGALVSFFGGADICKNNPNNPACTEKDSSGWTYRYLKEKVELGGGNESDIPQYFVDAFSDFEVCVKKAGISVSSWDEFEKLSDNAANMTSEQAVGLMSCVVSLKETAENFDDGDLELGL